MDLWVYMLRCADSSYYVGLTRKGLEKRLAEHQGGQFDGCTRTRQPVELVWSQGFQWLTDAIACERRIKGWRREKKEALIRGNYAALRGLARTAKRPPPSTGSGGGRLSEFHFGAIMSSGRTTASNSAAVT